MAALCLLVPALWRSFNRALTEYLAYLGSMSTREAHSILGLRPGGYSARDGVSTRAHSLVAMNQAGAGVTSPYLVDKIRSAKAVLERELE